VGLVLKSFSKLLHVNWLVQMTKSKELMARKNNQLLLLKEAKVQH
jgi:hypothetical protein